MKHYPKLSDVVLENVRTSGKVTLMQQYWLMEMNLMVLINTRHCAGLCLIPNHK